MSTNTKEPASDAAEATSGEPPTADEMSRLARFGTRKKIKVWYADPPWDIAQKGKRGAIQHYNLMTLERIKAMGPLIRELSDDNATLLLWVTNAALPAGIEVLKSWGFTYKSNAAWDKYYMGLGSYFPFQPRDPAPRHPRQGTVQVPWPALHAPVPAHRTQSQA